MELNDSQWWIWLEQLPRSVSIILKNDDETDGRWSLFGQLGVLWSKLEAATCSPTASRAIRFPKKMWFSFPESIELRIVGISTSFDGPNLNETWLFIKSFFLDCVLKSVCFWPVENGKELRNCSWITSYMTQPVHSWVCAFRITCLTTSNNSWI